MTTIGTTYEIFAFGIPGTADEVYRLVAIDDAGREVVLIDDSPTFSTVADEYERLTGDAIDSSHRQYYREEDVESLIDELVTPEILADYLCANSDNKTGIYLKDGAVSIGAGVGDEIDPDERAIVSIRCPGMGQLVMSWWRQGWDCDDLDDEDVVRQCCEDGDVDDEVKDLKIRLEASTAWLNFPLLVS